MSCLLSWACQPMTHHYARQCTSKHSVGDGDFSNRSNLLLRIPTLLNCHAGNRLRFSPVYHDIHNDKPLRHGYIHFCENYSILKPCKAISADKGYYLAGCPTVSDGTCACSQWANMVGFVQYSTVQST